MSEMAGSAAMPKRRPRCCICNQYNARRRIRDRNGIQRMACAGCVPQLLKNLRGTEAEKRP